MHVLCGKAMTRNKESVKAPCPYKSDAVYGMRLFKVLDA